MNNLAMGPAKGTFVVTPLYGCPWEEQQAGQIHHTPPPVSQADAGAVADDDVVRTRTPIRLIENCFFGDCACGAVNRPSPAYCIRKSTCFPL